MKGKGEKVNERGIGDGQREWGRVRVGVEGVRESE